MRAHWAVLRRRNQASALNSEEPGREGGLRLALVERENWGSFRLHLDIFPPFFQRLHVILKFSKIDMQKGIPCNTTLYVQISASITCPNIS